ncbi:hypothetical protein [Xanthomonas translucens]|uniref:hypothetical protein n=2 Tax=Xanthomonas translucens group TaxID=3390202 RepID=UPI000D355D89|nr:hypothetical protein [Xanthomonas translucens]
MRDFFNNGDIKVGGDFNVIGNSHHDHKFLIQCSNEELLAERPFRKENIRIEQRRKVNRLLPLYGTCLITFVIAAVMAMINGLQDAVTIIMGAGSLFVGFFSLKATLEPNAFQVDEQNAIAEINNLLKQRRVE